MTAETIYRRGLKFAMDRMEPMDVIEWIERLEYAGVLTEEQATGVRIHWSKDRKEKS